MADEQGTQSKATELFGSDRMWGLKELPLPDRVAYWPQTQGWYVVGALLLLALTFAGYRIWLRWRANRYRRHAIVAFDGMLHDRAGLNELPFLLRKAALTAFPRTQVAGLRGEAWIGWLNQTAGREVFTMEDASLLDKLCYMQAAAEDADQEHVRRLIEASKLWMRAHHAAV